MRPSQVLTTLFTFSTISSASQWPPSLQDIKALAGLDNVLHRRQNNIDAKPSGSDTTVTTGKTTTKDSGGSSSTKGKGPPEPTAKPIPFDTYPGGVNMIQPALTSGSQYYRVETTVTWVWNYTSLLRTPAHIDIVATMGPQSEGAIAPSPFTLAVNETFEKTQTFTWDTGKYYTSTSRLPVGTYTLQIYDADLAGGSSARPVPGKLAPYNQFYFGMYTPTAYYKPVPEFQCITCNAAGGNMERLTMGFLIGMFAITVSTFMWFTGTAGVL